jgi:hypothetical protein
MDTEPLPSKSLGFAPMSYQRQKVTMSIHCFVDAEDHAGDRLKIANYPRQGAYYRVQQDTVETSTFQWNRSRRCDTS